MKSIIRSLPFLALLIAPSALADKEQSDSCLRTKIWEDYTEGWAVRTATNTQLKVGEHKIYLVTLYAGNTYKFMVCGDESAVDIDLALHDAPPASPYPSVQLLVTVPIALMCHPDQLLVADLSKQMS